MKCWIPIRIQWIRIHNNAWKSLIKISQVEFLEEIFFLLFTVPIFAIKSGSSPNLDSMYWDYKVRRFETLHISTAPLFLQQILVWKEYMTWRPFLWWRDPPTSPSPGRESRAEASRGPSSGTCSCNQRTTFRKLKKHMSLALQELIFCRGGSQVRMISRIQTIPYSSQGFQNIIAINNPQKSISGNTGGRMPFFYYYYLRHTLIH